MYSEWSGLGFSWNSRQPVHPPPRFFFLQLCCSFLAIFLPFRSACVCFFVSTFFFNGEPPRVRRIQGAQRGSTILFSFLFLFFYLFYNRSTRSDEKQQKKPLQPAEMWSQPVEKATRRILEPRRRVDVVEMDVINWSRSDCCCSSLFPIRVESLIERFWLDVATANQSRRRVLR